MTSLLGPNGSPARCGRSRRTAVVMQFIAPRGNPGNAQDQRSVRMFGCACRWQRRRATAGHPRLDGSTGAVTSADRRTHYAGDSYLPSDGLPRHRATTKYAGTPPKTAARPNPNHTKATLPLANMDPAVMTHRTTDSTGSVHRESTRSATAKSAPPNHGSTARAAERRRRPKRAARTVTFRRYVTHGDDPVSCEK